MDITITVKDDKVDEISADLDLLFARAAGETKKAHIKRFLLFALKGHRKSGRTLAAQAAVVVNDTDAN